MAKKFFNNRVHNTKRTIINIVIIGICIIGVIICFVITSNLDVENHNKPGGELSLKTETTIEVNEEFTTEIFFSKIENVSLEDIKVTYPNDFDISKIGSYEISLLISGKTYTTTLIIVDTIKPELELKQVTIKENDTYTAKDFVNTCTDNSKEKCNIKFFQNGIDEEGNKVDYSNYKTAGIYSIKIIATDAAGNENVQETKLIIESNNNNTPTTKPEQPEQPEPPEKPTTCKYGNDDYDTNNYLIAVNITSNGCAVSLDLYKDTATTAGINKLMETETTRIKKDVEALKLNGTLALSRKVTAVINKSGDGIVGYELLMTVVLSNNGNVETVAEYKVNSVGRRVFITNTHNLST